MPSVVAPGVDCGRSILLESRHCGSFQRYCEALHSEQSLVNGFWAGASGSHPARGSLRSPMRSRRSEMRLPSLASEQVLSLMSCRRTAAEPLHKRTFVKRPPREAADCPVRDPWLKRVAPPWDMRRDGLFFASAIDGDRGD